MARHQSVPVHRYRLSEQKTRSRLRAPPAAIMAMLIGGVIAVITAATANTPTTSVTLLFPTSKPAESVEPLMMRVDVAETAPDSKLPLVAPLPYPHQPPRH